MDQYIKKCHEACVYYHLRLANEEGDEYENKINLALSEALLRFAMGRETDSVESDMVMTVLDKLRDK